MNIFGALLWVVIINNTIVGYRAKGMFFRSCVCLLPLVCLDCFCFVVLLLGTGGFRGGFFSLFLWSIRDLEYNEIWLIG